MKNKRRLATLLVFLGLSAVAVLLIFEHIGQRDLGKAIIVSGGISIAGMMLYAHWSEDDYND
jgi:hypothetical protein